MVTIGGPPDSLTAVQTGQVDVGWNVPEFSLSKIDLGKEIKLAFIGGDIPPFDDTTIRTQIAKASWLENNGDTAGSYWKGYARSLDWVYNNLDETYGILAETIDMDPSVVSTIMPKVLERGAYEKEDLNLHNLSLDVSNKFAAQFGIIDSKLSSDQLNTIVNLDYLPPEE